MRVSFYRLQPRLLLLERGRHLLSRPAPRAGGARPRDHLLRARRLRPPAAPRHPRPGLGRVVVWPATPDGHGARRSTRAAAPTWSSRRAASACSTRELEAGVLALRRPGQPRRLLGRRRAGDARPGRGRPRRSRSRALIPRYDLVFTYGGGEPVVRRLRAPGRPRLRADLQRARSRRPTTRCRRDPRFAADLGFLGNRLPDREARVDDVLLRRRRAPAAGRASCWAAPAGTTGRCRATSAISAMSARRDHNAFNCSALAVLNVNRASMAAYGFSPPTRVFEAAGAGACLITDAWDGIEQFLEPGREILVAAGRGARSRRISRRSTRRRPGRSARRRGARVLAAAHLRPAGGAGRGGARRPLRRGRRRHEARRPRPQHHLVLGQRPRHHLSRPAARARRAAATR